MSETSTTPKKRYNYQGSLEIDAIDKWVSSDYFIVTQCPGVDFHISTKRNHEKTLTIKVTKSYAISGIATIELVIDGLESVKKYVNNWKADVIFDNYVIPFSCDVCPKYDRYNHGYPDNHCMPQNIHKYKIPIACSIIWYGFTDELLSARIIKNMETYLKNSEFSDVKIVVKNNEEFPAHKIILASNSPVFKKMLTTDMKESKENCIKLPELDADTANELLYFLYHGKLDKAGDDYGMLSKLVEVADMYCLSDLKNVCDVSLKINLSCENALAVLELSRAFNLLDLQRQTLSFVASNVDSFIL